MSEMPDRRNARSAGEPPSSGATPRKVTVYLTSLVLGSLVLIGVWIITFHASHPDVFVLISHPLMLALCLWAARWLLLKRPLRTAEQAIFAGNCAFILGQLLSTALSTPNPTLDLSSSTYWTLVALSIVSYLIFSARTAVICTSALFVLSVAVPWGALYLKPADHAWPHALDLLRVQVTCAAILALLYALAWYRERYAVEQLKRFTLEGLAYTDPLTGLANRRRLYDVIHMELARASEEAPFSIILFDLDHFKQLNDTFGHVAGDRVLSSTAACLRKNLRTHDISGRWGGEEFLVILPGIVFPEALLIAERLRSSLARQQFEGVTQVTGSFGVASWWEGDTLERLVGRADAGLYRAKHGGRNQVAYAEGAGHIKQPHFL